MPDIEKVIKAAKFCANGCCATKDCLYYGEAYCEEKLLHEVLELLEVQESVKPLIAYDMYFCGNCKYAMPKTVNYCPKCGEKVMWS